MSVMVGCSSITISSYDETPLPVWVWGYVSRNAFSVAARLSNHKLLWLFELAAAWCCVCVGVGWVLPTAMGAVVVCHVSYSSAFVL